MWNSFSFVTIAVGLFLASGCSASLRTKGSDSRGQMVAPTAISQIKGRLAGGSELRLSECEGRVGLSEADAFVSALRTGHARAVLATTAVVAGEFSFSDLQLSDTTAYILSFDACELFLLRLVSGEEHQDLSAASTTIAATIDSAEAKQLSGDLWPTQRTVLDALQAAVATEPTGVSTVHKIAGSEDLARSYNDLFGVDVGALNTLAPFILVDAPAKVAIDQRLRATARTVHWDDSVVPAVSWFFNDRKVGEHSSLDISLPAGSVGNRNLQVTASVGTNGPTRIVDHVVVVTAADSSSPPAPPPMVASIVGWPKGMSNELAPSGAVSGDKVAFYRYKFGSSFAVNCGTEDGYSAKVPVTTILTGRVEDFADGPMTLCLVGEAASGGLQAFKDATSVHWTKDTVAPVAALSGTPAAISNALMLDVLVANQEGSSHFRYKVGTNADTDCAALLGYSAVIAVSNKITADLSGLADGDITLCVVVRDDAGNWQDFQSATVVRWFKNTASPTATVSGMPGVTSRDVVLNVLVGGDDVTHYSYKVGAAPSTDCASPLHYSASRAVADLISDSFTHLSDGSIRLCVRGRDELGNWQPLAAVTEYTWTKDTQAPGDFSITHPPARTNDGTPSVQWGAAAGASSYDVVIARDGVCTDIAQAGADLIGLTWTPSSLADGTYYVCVSAKDGAGNTKNASNQGKAFVVDTVPPGAFAITGPNALLSDAEPTVTWNASAGAVSYTVFIDTDADCTAPFVQTYENVAVTAQVLTELEDGSYRVCVVASDDAGNTVMATNTGTYQFIVDKTPPVILVSAYAGPQKGGAAVVGWTISEQHATSVDTATIEISPDGVVWTLLAQPAIGADGPLNNVAKSTSVTLPSWNETAARIRVRFTDAAGNSAAGLGAHFVLDSTPPLVTSLQLNEGDLQSSSNYLRVAVAAGEDGPGGGTMITHLCLKYANAVKPLAGDMCWVPVTATNDLSLSNHYFRIGFTPAIYTVYAFVKDAAGNVSDLSDNGLGLEGVDKKSIYVVPGKPPTLARISATSVAVPDDPPATGQMQAPAGSTVYIKWRVTDDEPWENTSIALSYTTDGVTYTPIAGAQNLNNASNGCTLDDPGTSWDDDATGCVTLTNGSPLSTYYRIRVTATDGDGMVAFGQSDALNLNDFRFLAGNTEAGLGGSATAAVFQMAYADMQAQKLVVHPTGKIFVLDARGLVLVDPMDGIQRLILPVSGSSSGDGGPLSAATTRSPYRIALTYDGHVVLSEYNRIRMINTAAVPMTIATLIGGGGSSADGTLAANFSITPTGFGNAPLIPLPNGDILFQASNYYPAVNGNIKRYVKNSGAVTSFNVSGPSFLIDRNIETSACAVRSFAAHVDPISMQIKNLLTLLVPMVTTGGCGYAPPSGNPFQYGDYVFLDPDHSFTPSHAQLAPLYSGDFQRPYIYELVNGLDGHIYAFSNWSGSNRHARIMRYDAVTKGWIHIAGSNVLGECLDGSSAISCDLRLQSVFVDSQSKIYMIDAGAVRTILDDGTILTLAGQKASYGDGGLARDARFDVISGLQLWNDGTKDRIIVSDEGTLRVREFTPGDGIEMVAGNGRYEVPNLTDLATAQGLTFGRDNRNAYMAVDAVGDIYVIREQGLFGKIVRSTGKWTSILTGFPGYGPQVIAKSATSILLGTHHYVTALTGSGNARVFQYTIGSGVLTEIGHSAVPEVATNICPNGTPLTDCNFYVFSSSHMSYGHWDEYDSVWYLKQMSQARIVKFAAGGNMDTLETLPRVAHSFAYRRNAGRTIDIIYYCGADGQLYQFDRNERQETHLAFPAPNMTCPAKGQLLYSASRNSVIFNFKENGLSGVAEYLVP